MLPVGSLVDVLHHRQWHRRSWIKSAVVLLQFGRGTSWSCKEPWCRSPLSCKLPAPCGQSYHSWRWRGTTLQAVPLWVLSVHRWDVHQHRDVPVVLWQKFHLLDVIVVLLRRCHWCPDVVELVSIFQVCEDHPVYCSCGAVDCILVLSNVDTLNDRCLDRPRCP